MPGSGKTLTITEKVKYLVEQEHVSPNQILLIAFTKKAAEEMTARNPYVKACTFHSLGLEILLNVKERRIKVMECLNEVVSKYAKENQKMIQETFTQYDISLTLHEFVEISKSFITLFKTNQCSFDSISPSSQQELQLLKMIQNIHVQYEEILRKENAIDFHDMITLATDYIKKYNLNLQYRYIIIDEFQDISDARYLLIKAICENAKAKLFCVGDDWQSIYGFSGSDIDLFYHFEKYFGKTQMIKLENTYRNSQELINIASTFIQKNPHQIKKILYSNNHIKNPIIAFSYQYEPTSALIGAIEDIFQKFGEEAEILLLGRTKYDLGDYLSPVLFYFPHSSKVVYQKYPKMKIKFLTVHEAKGLEAENVILLNLKDSKLGFPTKIKNESILFHVSKNSDYYDYAEERRLFYVCLTRTKNRVYLLVPHQKYSIFFQELKEIANIKVIPVIEKQKLEEIPVCPHCKKTHLIIKDCDGIKYWECPECQFGLKEYL